MMKKLVAMFVVFLFVFSMTAYVPAAEDDSSIYVYIRSPKAILNGTLTVPIDPANVKVAPYIKSDRTMVPIRFIAENFASTVNFDAKTETVSVQSADKLIKLTIGSAKIMINQTEITSDVAPEIIGDRTFVPLRVIAETLGKAVFYDKGFISLSNKAIFNKNTDQAKIERIISEFTGIPLFNSFDEYQKKVGSNDNTRYYMMKGALADDAAGAPVPTTTQEPVLATPSAEKSDAGVGVPDEHSTTNTQVEGVDEGDIIKTDGEYLYYLRQKNLTIMRADPFEKVSEIIFDEKDFSPFELYLNEGSITVIGNETIFDETVTPPTDQPTVTTPDAPNKMIARPYYIPNRSGTKIIVYDTSDITKPINAKDYFVEGNNIATRRIGSSFYIVNNKYSYYYANGNSGIMPYCKNSVDGDVTPQIDTLHYFPEMDNTNILTVASFSLQVDGGLSVSSYLGSGNNVYVSENSLYIATNAIYDPNGAGEKTTIYKFALSNGSVIYLNKGEVEGYPLNQYSFGEYDNHLRVVTTANIYSGQQNTTVNRLFVLDDNMQETGKIDNIAPGERVYSSRFLGAKGYVVTFRQVDPFFAIDLSDHYNPRVVGELKIPGYSDYLYPYDDTHIIGFGKDTVNGLYQGLKVSMFDVTDFANPVEKFSVIIGDRGTESSILHNPKALLNLKSKGLFGFDVSYYKIANKVDNAVQYGEFDHQGAYIYTLDLENGFTLKGIITHTDEKNDYLSFVERIVYAKNSLFTFSQNKVVKTDYETFAPLGQIELKVEPVNAYPYPMMVK